MKAERPFKSWLNINQFILRNASEDLNIQLCQIKSYASTPSKVTIGGPKRPYSILGWKICITAFTTTFRTTSGTCFTP